MASHETQNRAAVLSQAKGQLNLQNRRIPEPGPTQLLVRNRSIAVNPVDWKIQESGYIVEKYPIVLGSDVAGKVEAVGKDVQGFRVGDRVAGFALAIGTSDIDQGAFQTYTLLEQGATTRLPESVDYDDAATLPMAFATAAAALFLAIGLPLPVGDKPDQAHYKGQGLLVWGASSSVGSAAVQLGKQLGFTVFATASARHEAYVKSTLGADYFFERAEAANSPDVIVKAASDAGAPIKYGFDAISEKDTLLPAGSVLAQSGGSEAILVPTLPPAQVIGEDISGIKTAPTAAFLIFKVKPEIGQWVFNTFLPKALSDKSVVPSPPPRVVPGGLAATQEAWDLNKKGVSGLKLVIHVDDE